MIGRRLLLKGAAAMTGDGLVRPMNAPGAPDPVPGIQPGARGVVVASRVLILGANGALFAYDVNQPTAGELVASITGQQQLDGNPTPGNLALAGITAYVHRIIAPAGFYAGNLEGFGLQVYQAASEAGPWTAIAAVDYTINQGATGPVTGMRLVNLISGAEIVLSTATTFLQGTAVAQFSGCEAVASDPSNGLPEQWHTLALAAGWTQAVGFPIQYRLNAFGNVEWCGVATHAAFGVTTQLSNAALPTAYWPNVSQDVAPGVVDASDTRTGINVSSADGIVRCRANGAATTTSDPQGSYPLFVNTS